MANEKISYTERDFVGIRNELLNYTNQYYPDIVKNSNDASIFSVFLDLNAAVADNLNYHIDRSLQETVLQFQHLVIKKIPDIWGYLDVGHKLEELDKFLRQ